MKTTAGRSELVSTIGQEAPPLPDVSPRPLAGGRRLSTSNQQDHGGHDSMRVTRQLFPTPTSGMKRKFIKEEEDDNARPVGAPNQTTYDEFGDLDSDDERQLARLTDQSAAKRPRTTEEPSPAPTPTCTMGRTWTSPSQAPGSRDMSAGGGQQKAQAAPGDDYNITKEVMALLAGQQVKAPVLEAVRNHLNTYALRMYGVERARDMARSAVKTKDAKIAEQQTMIEEYQKVCNASKEKIDELRKGFEALERE